jgi:alpha-L-fucosidase 2
MLPALPDAWATGEISGLKARGNFEVSMRWKDMKLTNASVLAVVGGKCTIRTAAPIKIAGMAAVSKKTAYGYVTSFNSQKGVRYKITSII